VTMEQRRLGTTGVWVSQLCLGTMMFGEWGTKDHGESIRIIHRALDAGITFVDTADVYSAGESEVIVGKALAGRRDDIVLATKAFMPMSDNLNHRGSSRRWIIREAEDSLHRLGTDWIDLYQIHRWDPAICLRCAVGTSHGRPSARCPHPGAASHPIRKISRAPLAVAGGGT
jgi:aryl-alcohol dehydrogenase-like predicted oxidoreductase